MLPVLALFGGIVLGCVLERWLDRQRWRKAFLRIHAAGQIAVLPPPAVAELRCPWWGIDVTGTDQEPRSEWICGPECPKEA
jgi:hypothetical protein